MWPTSICLCSYIALQLQLELWKFELHEVFVYLLYRSSLHPLTSVVQILQLYACESWRDSFLVVTE